MLLNFFKNWQPWSLILLVLLSQQYLVCKVEGQDIPQDIFDTKSPIVIQYEGNIQHLAGSGNEDDNAYFGYSLAFMKQGSTKGGSVVFQPGESSDHGTLFIGVPRENRLSKNFGTIWGCKFKKTAQLSCHLVSDISDQSIDKSDTSQRCLQQLQKSQFAESESEQWIGASLSTNNQQLFACAPRWKRNGYSDENGYKCLNQTAIVGACYFTTFNTNDEELKNPEVQLVNPLYDKENFFYLSTDFTGARISEYLYLYGQYGMSSHVTFSGELIVGAPNVRKWCGSYVEYSAGNKRATIVNSKREIGEIEEHSLLGYAVTSGRRQGRSYYVFVGAPRADNLRGMVTLSESQSSRPVRIFKGDQLGSYFGYSVATADLNGQFNDDDELIVGAPLYTPDVKTDSSYATGCVFIYAVSNTQPVKRLCADSQRGLIRVTKGARFGTAIVNLGDLNFDLKEDFAVAAPYDDETGSVFIFHGGYPLSDNPVKVIRGKELGIPGLRGFGSQLLSANNNVDVDGNATPDLAIGAWESQHVVILRTRTVAKSTITVTFHTTNSKGTDGQINTLLPTQESFRVRVCVYFTMPPKFSAILPTNIKFETWIKLVGDPRDKRIEFDKVENKYSLSAREESCIDQTVRVVQDIGGGSDDNNDQIIFSALLWYNQTVTSLTPDSIRPATLQISPKRGKTSFKQDSSFEDKYQTFNPYLPAPINFTQSEIVGLFIAKDNCNSDGNPQCNPDLNIDQKLEIEDSDEKISPLDANLKSFVGQFKSIYVSIILSNSGETAIWPIVQVSLGITDEFEVNPTSIRFEWQKTPGRFGSCNSQSPVSSHDPTRGKLAITTLRCTTSLQHGKRSEYKLKISIDPAKAIKVMNKVEGKITVQTEAFPVAQHNERKQILFTQPLHAKLQIQVEDEKSSGQTEVDPRTSRVDLTQNYILKNTGFAPTSTEKVKVEIWVPAYIKNSKGSNTKSLGIVNPSTFVLRCKADNFEFFDQTKDSNTSASDNIGGSHSRSSRSINKSSSVSITPEKATLLLSDNMIVLTGCNTEAERMSSSCHKITCLTDLIAKETRYITLRMFVFQDALSSVLTEETTGIRVESFVLASFPENSSFPKSGSAERRFIRPKGIPAYYYLLAGGVGTILLVLVAFCLYKCGFFRRKQKEQLQQLKRQTMALDTMGALDLSVVDNAYDDADEIPD